MSNLENITEDITMELIEKTKKEIRRESEEKLKEEQKIVKQKEEENIKIRIEKDEEIKRIREEKDEQINNIKENMNNTAKAVRKDAHKKALIKAIGVSIFFIIVIVFTIIGLYFNINEEKNFIKNIACIVVSIPSIIGLIGEIKNFSKVEEKEYNKLCKKFNVKP